jgi:dolichyl-phosphate beta-glucosyltransferase
LATPLEYIASFYELFEQGHEVVWATRDIRKHHPKLWRRLISISGNILFRILCGSWVEDSQCGFKLFSAKTAKTCFSPLTINGWGFDMEVLTIAKINNIETMYRRIDGWKSVAGGTFDDRVFKNSVIAFGELLYIAAGRITGRYKVIKA